MMRGVRPPAAFCVSQSQCLFTNSPLRDRTRRRRTKPRTITKIAPLAALGSWSTPQPQPPPPPWDMAVTSNVTVTLCVADGPVAVTVIVYVPSGVVESVASVSIALAPAVTLLGAKPAVAPVGSPVAEKLRVSGVPAVDVVDSVVAPELPWTTLSVDGDAVSAKSGVAVTSNDTVVVCVAD